MTLMPLPRIRAVEMPLRGSELASRFQDAGHKPCGIDLAFRLP